MSLSVRLVLVLFLQLLVLVSQSRGDIIIIWVRRTLRSANPKDEFSKLSEFKNSQKSLCTKLKLVRPC